MSRPIREDDLFVIAHGRGAGEPAIGVARILDLPIVDLHQAEYPDRQVYARIDRENGQNNLRDKRLIYFGSTPNIRGISPSDVVVDYAMAADLFGRAQVEKLYQVVLYQPFAREDRTKGEVSALSAKVAIDIMTIYPPDKLLVVEPHTEYLELAYPRKVYPQFLWTTNFFAANVSHAFGQIDIRQNKVRGLAPDHGAKVRTSQFTTILRHRYGYLANPHFGLAEKERISSESTRLLGLSGRGALRCVWILEPDDIVGSGATLINPAEAAKKRNASVVVGVGTHGVLTLDEQGAPKILAELNKPNPALDGLVITNTLEIPDSIRHHPRVWMLDIAPYLAHAVHEAFGVPFPNRTNDQQGSLRALNRGEVKVEPQEMPAALREILQSKALQDRAERDAVREARALQRQQRNSKVAAAG